MDEINRMLDDAYLRGGGLPEPPADEGRLRYHPETRGVPHSRSRWRIIGAWIFCPVCAGAYGVPVTPEFLRSDMQCSECGIFSKKGGR